MEKPLCQRERVSGVTSGTTAKMAANNRANATVIPRSTLSVIRVIPAEVKDLRAHKAAPQQPSPWLEEDQGKHAQIEQSYVGEKKNFRVGSRGKKHGRAEAADDGKRRKYFRVLRERQNHGEDRDQQHGAESHFRGYEMVDLKRSP